MSQPHISIVVCTYQRPANLRRVLASIAGQRDVAGRFEVVIADDGSTDDTPSVVQKFRQAADFPVKFVTHPHRGFCPGRCRNEGVAASSAPYLLLLDGDCMIPPDHLQIQLAKRRPGIVRIGDCIRLSEDLSARVDEASARRGDYLRFTPWNDRWQLWRQAGKSWLYNRLNHPTKPRLVGNHLAIWRDDYLRLNGFDENYIGWGAEDDDFGYRLRRAGLRLESILWWTGCYHLWHPRDPSAPVQLQDGPNFQYFHRGFHLIRCASGVTKRTWRDLKFQFLDAPPSASMLRRIFPAGFQTAVTSAFPEVEIAFSSPREEFSGRAQCNLLIVPDDEPPPTHLATQAHLTLSPLPLAGVRPERQFRLDQFGAAMDCLLFNKVATPAVQKYAG